MQVYCPKWRGRVAAIALGLDSGAGRETSSLDTPDSLVTVQTRPSFLQPTREEGPPADEATDIMSKKCIHTYLNAQYLPTQEKNNRKHKREQAKLKPPSGPTPYNAKDSRQQTRIDLACSKDRSEEHTYAQTRKKERDPTLDARSRRRRRQHRKQSQKI
ncbi:hypothetical protein BJ508DRAFT_337631 [Ascobolus immersus RN42]|uniref:Uncharacterized protein n=1 Tax=Ascobolus immersus RN42 TaxID=1160509 RepID=A0A3N4IKQ4_ASCIM|nr:hypothetical protein BJ508DRAFT_337631 [Ascobolus immersus RN42]